MTLHGTTIPAGSVVMLINGSATRDERAFDSADRFDINRFRPGTTSTSGMACTAVLAPHSRGWKALSRSTSCLT